MRRWIDRLRLRMRSLLRQNAVDAQLQRELRFHLDQQIGEYLAAGMTPDEARATALRAFGPIGRIEEECRDTRGVTFIYNLVQDLRYARRSLTRQPQLVVAATVSIAVGVSANSTIFSVATELLLSSPTAYRADRLVRIRTGNGSHVSYRQWQDLDQSGALAGIAGYQIEKEVLAGHRSRCRAASAHRHREFLRRGTPRFACDTRPTSSGRATSGPWASGKSVDGNSWRATARARRRSRS
jgi:hypothetical protein